MASDNGRIVKVLGVTGRLADLDVDGSRAPADEAKQTALDVTDDEQRQLGRPTRQAEFVAGSDQAHDALRFQLAGGSPAGSDPLEKDRRRRRRRKNPDEGLLDNPCKERVASWVDCENQSLRKRSPWRDAVLVGHQSDRVWGATRRGRLRSR
ncbi:MAG: hypothetical protein IPL30_10115 [Elusimicrobia bacterium]|nr:hypothetical protein [Elusimicrobiota bacterium]